MSENTWLINEYCHLVNKTFLFVGKYFEGVIPAGRLDPEIVEYTKKTYKFLANYRESGQKAAAWQVLEEYLRFATDYFEQADPWKIRESDRRACRNAILNSVQMIANLTYWLKELSFGDQRDLCPASKVEKWLSLDAKWQIHYIHSGYELPQIDEIIINSAKNSFQMA